jgi:hypothetical protein
MIHPWLNEPSFEDVAMPSRSPPLVEGWFYFYMPAMGLHIRGELKTHTHTYIYIYIYIYITYGYNYKIIILIFNFDVIIDAGLLNMR